MTTEATPPAEEQIELEIPADMYIGQNVVRKHVAEFFYRASTQALLSTGESVLAIFDCVLLEDNGRRLGGLTLHDYAVLTDQHLITWGRGLNRDVIDKFSWPNIVLDKFGRRTPIEGVIKIGYNMRNVSGTKRRISIKGAQTEAEAITAADAVTPSTVAGVVLYLDLMPLGDVRVCAGMMHYLMSANEAAPGVSGFKEHFRAEINRSQQRMANVNALMRPFYMDLGNGILVEADTVQELRAVRGASPYRNPASPYRGVSSPYRSPGVRVNRGEASAAALNKGNRPTDTTRGTGRDGDTNAPGGREVEGNNLRETVRLNPGTLDRPSKLEDYENRVAGRPTRAGSSPSRLEGPGTGGATRAGVYEAPTASRPAPSPRPAPAPRPAPRPAASRPAPAPRVSSIPPAGTRTPRPPRQVVSAGEVLDETGTKVSGGGSISQTADGYAERPVVIPIAVAIPRALLNPYSLSRLARGLWIDPRNLTRNLGDLSQTAGAVLDVADVVVSDEEARNIAVRRVRSSAYSVFRDNIILHYTVWPFVKPLLDLILLPSDGEPISARRSRLRVRGVGEPLDDFDEMDDMGVMTGGDLRAAPDKPQTVTIVEDVPSASAEAPVARKPVDVPGLSNLPSNIAPATTVTETHLNVSGKGLADPTTGSAPEPPSPPSKLGDLPGEGGNSKKIGFKDKDK